MQRKDVKLKPDEIDFLRGFLKTGRHSKREYDRANVLLLLNKGKKDGEIADFLNVERTTIWRIRKKYLGDGLHKALAENERSGQPKKYGTDQEAEQSLHRTLHRRQGIRSAH